LYRATLVTKCIQARELGIVQGIEELPVTAGADCSVCLVYDRETGPPVTMSHEEFGYLVE